MRCKVGKISILSRVLCHVMPTGLAFQYNAPSHTRQDVPSVFCDPSHRDTKKRNGEGQSAVLPSHVHLFNSNKMWHLFIVFSVVILNL